MRRKCGGRIGEIGSSTLQLSIDEAQANASNAAAMPSQAALDRLHSAAAAAEADSASPKDHLSSARSIMPARELMEVNVVTADLHDLG